MERPVRVLLDVNIFIANLIAHDRGHAGTAAQSLVSLVSHQIWGIGQSVQLVISLEMIETLERVLHRLHYRADRIRAYSAAVIDIMKFGPDGLDPYLILGGEERFALSDLEDAGVLATAFGAGVDLLVTDNLRDFASKDASVKETQVVKTAAGTPRLQALRYTIGSADLVVAHPFDVMQWIRLGHDFTPERLWNALR